MATIDLDPITATDFLGTALDVEFIVGPDLNAISSLEFSPEYGNGQPVIARAVDNAGRSRNCTFSIRLEGRSTESGSRRNETALLFYRDFLYVGVRRMHCVMSMDLNRVVSSDFMVKLF